jgi:hypothetical protein
MNKIPKVCPVAADVQFYAKFINDQCTGQPGFPLTIGASAAAEPAGPPPSSASPSGAGAAPSPATPASGAHNNAATSVGTAKPATFTGSAASRSMAQEVSAGTVAMAACLAMLGF